MLVYYFGFYVSRDNERYFGMGFGDEDGFDLWRVGFEIMIIMVEVFKGGVMIKFYLRFRLYILFMCYLVDKKVFFEGKKGEG